MSAKRKLLISLFSIIFVVFAVITTFSVVFALTQQEFKTSIDVNYTAEDIDGYVVASYTVGNTTNYLTPVGNNIDGNKLIFKAGDVENAGSLELPGEVITLTEENDNLIIKYSYSNTGGKHYIASMDFESELIKNNMIVEYGIKDSQTGNINYSTDRYAVVVPASSTNKEYYIKISIDDKAYQTSFAANINWILQGCDPQSAEYLSYESLDIQGRDGAYTASYTGGYLHTGELIYPTEINGSPVTAVSSNESITEEQKSYVKKVVIPNSVTKIENNAFKGFNYLEEVVFGEESEVGAQSLSTSSLTTIGEYAFADCSKLENLDIPNSVTSVGENVFENCYNLKQITIPNGVTTLNDAMFKNCSSLTTVEISENIVDFPAEIFSGCTELVNFEMPKCIETVGTSAFKDCARMVGELDLYFATTIGESAFEGCANLTKITIGENIINLGNNTFAGCENVEKFYLLSHESITNLNDINVFNNINEDCKIYVIETLLNDYSSNENWATYANHFEEIGFTTNGECIDSLEAPVIDMRIYGNSIQNGTPTPDAPVEIESVGEKTKNLFDKSSSPIKKSSSGLIIEEIETGVKFINPALSSQGPYISACYKIDSVENIGANTVYISANIELGVLPKVLMGLGYCDEDDNNRKLEKELSITTSGKHTTSMTIDTKTYAGKYLCLWLYSIAYNGQITLEEGAYVEYSNLMLSIGESDYEPYGYKVPVKVNDTITNIYLDEPLRKVGDYADYIDYKNKKVVRRVKKVDLGSLTWKYDASNLYFYSQSLSNREKGAKNMICSHYPVKYQSLTSGDDFIRGSTTNFIIQVKDLDYQDVLDFKYSVAGMILYYEVLTPIEEAITIPEFNTINGGTTLEVLTNVQPSHIMVKYHK